ncbi:MAG: sialidase family protein, partial [Nitrososphaera sp.]
MLGEKNLVNVDNFQTSIIKEKGEQGHPGPEFVQDLVHVVWERDVENSEIIYKRDGAGFDPTTLNLSKDIGSSQRPAIAVSDQNVYVVWSDSVSSEIFYARSTDGGATFGPTENISNDEGFSSFPAIAALDNKVYVVWRNEPGIDQTGSMDIFYKRSVDSGATFGPAENLSINDGSSTRPKVAAFDDNVYVVWQDSTEREILYRRSINGGATFNDVTNLSNNAGLSQTPDISTFGDKVYVVWDDSTPGNEEIFYRQSSDGGITFGNTINLSNNGQESASPAIAALDNNVHIVWKDELPPFDPFGNAEIFYRRSTDSGITFGNTVNLSN